MPRPKRIPTLVHHKPSGHARVRIQGRDFYLGPFGTADAEAAYHKLIGEWLSTGQLPPPAKPLATSASPTPSSEDILIKRLILRYWRHARQYYRKNDRPTDHVWMIRGVLRLLRDHYGDSPIADFGPKELKTLRAVLIHRGLTRSGVNRRIDVVRQAFRWGVEEDLVPPVVLQKLIAVQRLKKGRSVAPDPPPIQPVATDDLEKTRPELGPVVRDMVELQLLTGARPGELCSLRPIDVDCSGEVWEYRPSSHKLEHHGKDRVVCFGEKSQAILARYFKGRPAEAYCFSPAEAEQQRLAERHAARKTPLSCGNRPGSKRAATPKRRPKDCYTVASYRRAITRACKRAGVPAWAPNQLRQTRATELRKLFGIEAVRTVLGHSRLNTSEIYAERDLAEARRIMRQVG